MDLPSVAKTSGLLTPTTACHVLQDMGYRGKLELANGWAYVHSAAHGADFRVTLYSRGQTDADTACRSCQFRLSYSVSRYTDMDELNERCRRFNADMRFSKTYAYDYEGRPFVALEMDAITEHGDGPACFEDAAGVFIYGIAQFLADVMADLPEPMRECSANLTRSIPLLRGAASEVAEGVDLLRDGARQGFAGAMNNYGDLFERGHGVAQNDVASAYWYARAAERGEPTAYLSLASLLSASSADTAVRCEALKFATLAFHQLPEGTNKDKARYLVDTLSDILPGPERDAAFESASAWRPLYQERLLLSDTPDKIAPIAEPPTQLN